MKEIKLNQQGKNRGKFVALVDNEDYEPLNQFKWNATKGRRTFYAIRKEGHRTIYMHRVIMETPDNLQVDHIDHNGLNNQKSNLRNCTHGQNQSNRKASGKSKYLGVSFINGHIRAQIGVNKKAIVLGDFNTEAEAALAYNEAAIKYHGEFANLNILT